MHTAASTLSLAKEETKTLVAVEATHVQVKTVFLFPRLRSATASCVWLAHTPAFVKQPLYTALLLVNAKPLWGEPEEAPSFAILVYTGVGVPHCQLSSLNVKH